MSEVRNTTIEENFPNIRRKKSNPTLDNIIKTSIATAFLTLVEGDKGHRPSLAQSQQAIAAHFRRIHSIIDTVDEHITRRLQNHENEVFSLVKGEIEEMREETQRIVEQLNQAIAQKNTEDEIWKLSNELDYFKTQTSNLFNENKKIREQSNNLKNTLRELQVQIENNDLLMQKLKKKFMRESFIKDKLAGLIRQKIKMGRLQEITLEQVDDILSLQKVTTRTRMRTEPSREQNNSKFFQSKVDINLNNNASMHANAAKFTFNEQHQRRTEKFSIPSSFNEEQEGNDMPPARFVRVESFFTEEVEGPKSSVQRRMVKQVERGMQTEELRTEDETHRLNAAKPFSNTSYIEIPRGPPAKKLDLYKSGFFVRSYNQKAQRLASRPEKSAIGVGKKQATHNRYLSNALDKSKMLVSKVQVRGSTNKSSLK